MKTNAWVSGRRLLIIAMADLNHIIISQRMLWLSHNKSLAPPKTLFAKFIQQTSNSWSNHPYYFKEFSVTQIKTLCDFDCQSDLCNCCLNYDSLHPEIIHVLIDQKLEILLMLILYPLATQLARNIMLEKYFL